MPARRFRIVCRMCSTEWDYEAPSLTGGRMPTLCDACKPLAAAERQRRYIRKHPERVRDAKRRWVEANPEAMASARSAWEAEHPEARRAFRRARKKLDPISNRAYVRARRARLKSQTVVPFTAAQLRARLAYFGNLCWMCGASAEVIEHVKPLARGGAHALCNIRPACAACNTKKGSLWPFPTSPSSFHGWPDVLTEQQREAG